MNDITYFSVNEFSKGILEFAEQVEYAKALQAQTFTVDKHSIVQLEQDIGERKWAISEFLNSSSNYEEWKKSTNNNAEMLTKYVEKGYFQEEFSHTQLKQTLEHDFLQSLQSHPELGYTKREKILLKHDGETTVSHDQLTAFNQFDTVVSQIHNKEKCFSRNFSHMLKQLPEKMTKEVEKISRLVKANPLLLQDNPHHFIVNRGLENPSVHCEQLKEILEEANIGDPSATSKLAKLTTSFEQMNKGNTNKKLIEQYRSLFMGTKNTSIKNDI